MNIKITLDKKYIISIFIVSARNQKLWIWVAKNIFFLNPQLFVSGFLCFEVNFWTQFPKLSHNQFQNIQSEIQVKYPQLPWRKMYGLRNLISHEYFGIDYEIIWEIASKNLPQNKEILIQIIEDLGKK